MSSPFQNYKSIPKLTTCTVVVDEKTNQVCGKKSTTWIASHISKIDPVLQVCEEHAEKLKSIIEANELI